MDNESREFYTSNGWVVVRNAKTIDAVKTLREVFIAEYETKFSDDAKRNRTIIKRFADRPDVSAVFSNAELIEQITRVSDIQEPTYCGPIVSHYSSNDLTGGGYGLPFHQDYPSMASSKNSVITWVALNDSSLTKHGVKIVSSQLNHKLLAGEQTAGGYVLANADAYDKHAIVPELKTGEVLIMSSFTPHKTYVNPRCTEWKLSLSRRFDDFADKNWQQNGYDNAYNISVDRELYLKQVQ